MWHLRKMAVGHVWGTLREVFIRWPVALRGVYTRWHLAMCQVPY